MHSADDDLDAQLLWMPVLAKLVAQSGNLEKAIALAVDAATRAEATDGLNRRAAVQIDLSEVLVMAGRSDDAKSALASAADLFEQKGNVVGMARALALRDQVAIV
jgi:hypothetical protein